MATAIKLVKHITDSDNTSSTNGLPDVYAAAISANRQGSGKKLIDGDHSLRRAFLSYALVRR